eukprot:14974242-Alexandrium_andersonii.AAC.1
MRAKHGDSVAAGGQTDPTPPQLEDRALRECCANAIVVSCMALNDQHHRKAVDAMIARQRPLD